MTSARATWLRLTLFGLLSGLIASLVVLAFEAAVDFGQSLLLPPAEADDYSALHPLPRLLLPVLGGFLLGVVFDLLRPEQRDVGVVHLLRRLHTPGGERLPLANLLVQFAGAVVAIVSGHSVDKEGPSVHLGAASANVVGQQLRISAEEDYTLAACGAAAAIAAAFNTPLAGIVFVVEVLQVRYEVSRFLPVIVASVVGAMITGLLRQTEPAFALSGLHLTTAWEYPNLILLGLLIGVLAILFIALCELIAARAHGWRNRTTFATAGLITGILALGMPQIMGASHDTLDALLAADLDLYLVVSLMLAKLLATATAVGMRVPGGLIGPTLFIGGAAGSGIGLLIATYFPLDAASPSFYATVGMVAMMGATLRAPLAALTALLELTANPNIILPGMLAVASAELTNRLALGKESVFETLMRMGRTP